MLSHIERDTVKNRVSYKKLLKKLPKGLEPSTY